MTEINDYGAALCGQIDTEFTPENVIALNMGWRAERLSPRLQSIYSGLLYASFVESMARAVDSEGKLIKHGNIYDRIEQLTLDIGEVRDGICLESLNLYFMPGGVCLWDVRFSIAGGRSLSQITQLGNDLRAITASDNADISWIKEILSKYLIEITANRLPSDLTQRGNKPKLFQWGGVEKIDDKALFELGVLLPEGAVDGKCPDNHPSEQYYRRTIDSAALDVYANWKALALNDTFTVLVTNSTRKPEFNRDWAFRYRFIYLQCLYQKVVLFAANDSFRTVIGTSEIETLVSTAQTLERYYGFTHISYNFLPQLIFESIDRSMDISQERNQLRQNIEAEAKHRERVSQRRVSSVLNIITMLAAISMIYDGCSLFYQYHAVSVAVGILLAVIGICFGVRRLFKSRRP